MHAAREESDHGQMVEHYLLSVHSGRQWGERGRRTPHITCKFLASWRRSSWQQRPAQLSGSPPLFLDAATCRGDRKLRLLIER